MYTNRRSDPLKNKENSQVKLVYIVVVLLFNSDSQESWDEKMKILFNTNLGTTLTDRMVEKEILKLHKSYLHISNKNLSGTRKSFPSDQMSWHLT